MAETKTNASRPKRSSAKRPSSSRRSSKKTNDAVTPDPSPSLESELHEFADAFPADDESAEHRPPICSVAFCPICMVVTAVGDARPDLIQHLLLASREFLLAVRSVIDARLEGAPPPSKLERISIE